MITEEFGNPWMANLREIDVPESISMIPQAPGWYVLAGLLAAGFLWLLWRLNRRWRSNAYRREALRRLEVIETSAAIAERRTDVLTELPLLLKQTALAAYPREQVASLSGEAWLGFLDGAIGAKEFSRGLGRLLCVAAYSPSGGAPPPAAEVRYLVELSRRWIRRHRAVPAASLRSKLER